MWVLIAVGILIFSGLIYVYINARKELVPAFSVTVEIDGTLKNPNILSIDYSMYEAPKTEEPRETKAHFPGVYLMVLGASGESDYLDRYTEWASTNFNGKGVYKIKAGFITYPKHGELLKIEVKIVDDTGSRIFLRDFLIKWNFEPVVEASCTVETINGNLTISNTDIKKDWYDPEVESIGDSENIPGVYFVIEKDNKKVNYISSVSYKGEGDYTIRSYFKNEPKILEKVQYNIDIKNSDGSILLSYPGSNPAWEKLWVT